MVWWWWWCGIRVRVCPCVWRKIEKSKRWWDRACYFSLCPLLPLRDRSLFVMVIYACRCMYVMSGIFFNFCLALSLYIVSSSWQHKLHQQQYKASSCCRAFGMCVLPPPPRRWISSLLLLFSHHRSPNEKMPQWRYGNRRIVVLKINFQGPFFPHWKFGLYLLYFHIIGHKKVNGLLLQ